MATNIDKKNHQNNIEFWLRLINILGKDINLILAAFYPFAKYFETNVMQAMTERERMNTKVSHCQSY